MSVLLDSVFASFLAAVTYFLPFHFLQFAPDLSPGTATPPPQASRHILLYLTFVLANTIWNEKKNNVQFVNCYCDVWKQHRLHDSIFPWGIISFFQVKKTATICWCWRKVSRINVSSLTRWSSVLLPLGKPLWEGVSRLFESRYEFTIALIIQSKILYKQFVSAIGL